MPRQQEPWQARGEQFERDLYDEASWFSSSAADDVDDTIGENWQPVKKRRGLSATEIPRYDTREKAVLYYKRVRDLATDYLTTEENLIRRGMASAGVPDEKEAKEEAGDKPDKPDDKAGDKPDDKPDDRAEDKFLSVAAAKARLLA